MAVCGVLTGPPCPQALSSQGLTSPRGNPHAVNQMTSLASSTSLYDSSGDIKEEAAPAPSFQINHSHYPTSEVLSCSVFRQALFINGSLVLPYLHPGFICSLCTLIHVHEAHFPFNSKSQFHHQSCVTFIIKASNILNKGTYCCFLLNKELIQKFNLSIIH